MGCHRADERAPTLAILLFSVGVSLVLMLLGWNWSLDKNGMVSPHPKTLPENNPDEIVSIPEVPLEPIVFLHGINGHSSDFDDVVRFLRQKFGPTLRLHSLNVTEGAASLFTPMMDQRDRMVDYLASHASELGIQNQSFRFVAHSQGALLARSVIQKLPPSLQVSTFVSLAGPQRGQWGSCATLKMNDEFKDLYRKMGRSVGWWAFYNPVAQRKFSFAGYWNDPRHPGLFQRECRFLPYVNGYANHSDDTAQQKANFLRVRKAVFLGSSSDECINPPLTSVWEFVGTDGNTTVPMEQSWEYRSDAFGLRTMHQQGRLTAQNTPGIRHTGWLQAEIFEEHVLPHLLSNSTFATTN